MGVELYQIRYFLAVCRTLNFTRAAEDCHVSQPALTRAVQKLEQELGGPLFRREGRRTHLTDLGRAMLPPLQQSLEAAEQAKEQAESYGRGDVAPLRIGLSESVPLHIFLPLFRELARAYPGLRLELSRGNAPSIMAMLEDGAVELVLAAIDGETWSRIDSWPLFTEDMRLCLSPSADLAAARTATAADLGNLDLVARRHCETTDFLADKLHAAGIDAVFRHSSDRESDFATLIAMGAAAGIAPRTIADAAPAGIVSLPIADFDLRRTVSLFAVAGRRYTTACAGLIRLARSMDWDGAVNPGPEITLPPALQE